MLLIAANLTVFFYQLSLGRYADQLIYLYGVIPASFTAEGISAEQVVRFTAAMFLHGGWLHVLSNMLYLWIFGDNVEDRMGHLPYLAFYLTCGYLASLVHVLSYPASKIPMIGASGAIAGVLGAYFVLFPRASVLTLVFIFFFIQIVPIPAIVFLGLWFLLQILNAAASTGLAGEAASGVAFWAHAGGFLAGVFLVKFFDRH